MKWNTEHAANTTKDVDVSPALKQTAPTAHNTNADKAKPSGKCCNPSRKAQHNTAPGLATAKDAAVPDAPKRNEKTDATANEPTGSQ